MALLELQGMTKIFGGVTAVNDVSLRVEAGRITSLIGPNGAGKTTLFNLATGLYTPTAGRLLVDGREARGLRTDRIVRLGIARTFQNIRLFGALSVLDNVRLGMHARIRSGALAAVLRTPAMRQEERDVTRRAMALLDFVGLSSQAGELAGSLAYGDQRRVEIARALAADPKLLLLDEPAAGMNPSETVGLMNLIGSILERGTTIFLIEHDMKLVMRISHTVHVLDHGELIASGPPEAVQGNPAVIAAYLGVPDEDPLAATPPMAEEALL